MRWTPNRSLRSFLDCSLLQQNSERWIGQYSFFRSLMGFLLSRVQWHVVMSDARIHLLRPLPQTPK